MIQGRDICKEFDGFQALHHVSFHVRRGGVYGLVGPNGAGKSTLLRHVAGIFRQDSGELLVEGEPIYENSKVKEKMAFIPDDIFYFRQASILHMKKYYQGIYSRFDEEVFEKLRQNFSNLDFASPIRQMSRGMQKQAAFVLAISLRPEILVLDEPVDGLDPVMRRQIWSILLGEVSEREMTVLISSHNLRELEDVCDSVGIMNRGEVILERSLEDLQGGITKLQVAFSEELPDFGEDLQILHQATQGRITVMIVRGKPDWVTERVEMFQPLILDVLPLTLEEVFIYELGGREYEVKEILL